MVYRWEWRKRLRLENYDYSWEWWYFLTFCTKGRLQYFWEIIDWKMILNEYGNIFKNIIEETINIRKEIILDEYVIMPNHIHVLVFVKNPNPNNKPVGNAGMRSWWNGCSWLHERPELNKNTCSEKGPHACGPYGNENKNITKNYISNYVQWLKSSFTRDIRKKINDYEFAWQKSFYDVIIRNDDQLEKSREYISLNPEKWENDVNNNCK